MEKFDPGTMIQRSEKTISAKTAATIQSNVTLDAQSNEGAPELSHSILRET